MNFTDAFLVGGIVGITFIVFLFVIAWFFIKSAVYHGTKQAVSEVLSEVLAKTGFYVYTEQHKDFHDME